MTTPPINDNISKLFLTDTFYSWFLKTNDLIDKVNPISLYGISADSRNPAPDGKNYDGITIADLGEGYYRIGYHLPHTILGTTHEFKEWLNVHGISGTIVNTINGRTGDLLAVQAASGRTADIVTGNLERVVFSVNGFTGTTGGAVNIPGLITGTYDGNRGDILVVNEGGTYDNVPFIEDMPLSADIADVNNQMGFKANVTDSYAAIMLAGNKINTDTDPDHNPLHYYGDSNHINYNYYSADELGTVIHIPTLTRNLRRVALTIPTKYQHAAGILFTDQYGGAIASSGNLNIRTGHRVEGDGGDGWSGWRDLDWEDIKVLDLGLNIITNPYTPGNAANREFPSNADGSTSDRGAIAVRFNSAGNSIFNYSDYANPFTWGGEVSKWKIGNLTRSNLDHYKVNIVTGTDAKALNAIFPTEIDGAAYVNDWKLDLNPAGDEYVAQKFRSIKGMQFQWEPQGPAVQDDWNSILMTPWGNLILGWIGGTDGCGDGEAWFDEPFQPASGVLTVDGILAGAAIKMHGFGGRDGRKGQIQTIGGFENVYTDTQLGGFDKAQNYFRLNTNFENCNITVENTTWSFDNTTLNHASTSTTDFGSSVVDIKDAKLHAYTNDSLSQYGEAPEPGLILVTTKDASGNTVNRWEAAANIREWSVGVNTGNNCYCAYLRSARTAMNGLMSKGRGGLCTAGDGNTMGKQNGRAHESYRPIWYYVYSMRTLGKESGGVTYSNAMAQAYRGSYDLIDNFMGPDGDDYRPPVRAFPAKTNNYLDVCRSTIGCTLSDVAYRALGAGGYKNYGLPFPAGAPISGHSGGSAGFCEHGMLRYGYQMRGWPVQSRCNDNLWWGLAETSAPMADPTQSCYLDDQTNKERGQASEAGGDNGGNGYLNGTRQTYVGRHKHDFWRRLVQEEYANGFVYSDFYDIINGFWFSGPYQAVYNSNTSSDWPTYKSNFNSDGTETPLSGLHEALRTTRDLAPYPITNTYGSYHGAGHDGPANTFSSQVGATCAYLSLNTPFSPGAWGSYDKNTSTLFASRGHAAIGHQGSFKEYQKYPTIVYEHPFDMVGSYAMNYLTTLGNMVPEDGSRYTMDLDLEWKIPNGTSFTFVMQPGLQKNSSTFKPSTWGWGGYRMFYETLGGSAGWVDDVTRHYCQTFRDLKNIPERVINDHPEASTWYTEDVQNARLQFNDSNFGPHRFDPDGRIYNVNTGRWLMRGITTDAFPEGSAGYYRRKGAGKNGNYDQNDAFASVYDRETNKRYPCRYYTTNKSFYFTESNYSYGPYHGHTYSNLDCMDPDDPRHDAIHDQRDKWRITGDQADHKNPLGSPWWDGSKAFFTGEKTMKNGNKRIGLRYIKQRAEDGSVDYDPANYASETNHLSCPHGVETGPNDSVYKALDFETLVTEESAPGANDEKVYSSNRFHGWQYSSQYAFSSGVCLWPGANKIDWDKQVEDINYGMIDLNDGWSGSSSFNGFWLQYRWMNNYKPRSFTQYNFDATDIANPPTINGAVTVDWAHLGPVDRRMSKAGKMTISTTVQVDGGQLVIPTICTNATCSSDFEFNCNEWSNLHNECDNILAEEKQLYTDGSIYRCAAGWSATKCTDGWTPDSDTTLHSGGNFSGNNEDAYSYAGILKYDNDLAERRDWNNNPVKVYEQFYENSAGDPVIMNSYSLAHTGTGIMISPTNIRISR